MLAFSSEAVMRRKFFISLCLCAPLLVQVTPSLAQAPPPTKNHAAKVVVLVEKVYPVADLIVPIEQDVGLVAGPQENSSRKQEREPKTLEHALMGLLRCNVAPESWSENGGRGTIQYFPVGMSLVIRQSPTVHERIKTLFTELRRPQEVEVAVELRLLSVSSELPPELLNPAGKGQTLLTDEQVRRLLESAQGDRHTQIMQAPKLTAFNGQRALISIGQSQYFVTGINSQRLDNQLVGYTPKNEAVEFGLKAAIRPLVSADRRTVDLSLCLSVSNLDGLVPLIPVQVPVPQIVQSPGLGVTTVGQPTVLQLFLQQPKVMATKVERVFKIPDGQTVLVDAGTTSVEKRNEYGPPVLSRIPYVSRLFRNVGYGRENMHLYVLVTPRIVINPEPERLVPVRVDTTTP
jgi:type II secretory pathway component GspD/PulD (secretin)